MRFVLVVIAALAITSLAQNPNEYACNAYRLAYNNAMNQIAQYQRLGLPYATIQAAKAALEVTKANFAAMGCGTLTLQEEEPINPVKPTKPRPGTGKPKPGSGKPKPSGGFGGKPKPSTGGQGKKPKPSTGGPNGKKPKPSTGGPKDPREKQRERLRDKAKEKLWKDLQRERDWRRLREGYRNERKAQEKELSTLNLQEEEPTKPIKPIKPRPGTGKPKPGSGKPKPGGGFGGKPKPSTGGQGGKKPKPSGGQKDPRDKQREKLRDRIGRQFPKDIQREKELLKRLREKRERRERDRRERPERSFPEPAVLPMMP